MESPDSPLVLFPLSQSQVSDLFTLGQVCAHAVHYPTTCAYTLFTTLPEPLSISPKPALREAAAAFATAHFRALPAGEETHSLVLSMGVRHPGLALPQGQVFTGIGQMPIHIAVFLYTVSFFSSPSVSVTFSLLLQFCPVKVYVAVQPFILITVLIKPFKSAVHIRYIVSMLIVALVTNGRLRFAEAAGSQNALFPAGVEGQEVVAAVSCAVEEVLTEARGWV